MLDDLGEMADTGEFEEAWRGDGEQELERLMDSKPYMSASELGTRHDGPAFVEEDAVTKTVPAKPDELEENHLALAKAGISFPSAVYWSGYCRDDHVTAMQQVKAFGSEDSGFWKEIEDYSDEFREAGVTAASEGVVLDYKPQNFGVLEDQLVYLDTGDSASVRTGYPSSEARAEMADSLVRGMMDAPVTASQGWMAEIVNEFNGELKQKYARDRE